MEFTKYSKIYYVFSGLLVILSIGSLIFYGLNFGIEFTGGSVMELEFLETRPENNQILKSLEELELGQVTIQPSGERNVILKFKEINQETHRQITENLNELSPAQELSFYYIGPSIGRDLRQKTLIAALLTLTAITVYVAFAFRKVSRPVSSFKYGITALLALFHDMLIPLGIFSILGKFYGVEITVPIVAALLTILGYSVHDTIVIFDRIRENIIKNSGESFNKIVNLSLNQTLGRSLTTTITILLVMAALLFLGGDTLKYFSLILIIGITAGTYSSIFLAGPLLSSWANLGKKRGD